MFVCKLCKEETVFTTYLCDSCQKIKHMMNIYGTKRVHEILENVLVRNSEQQEKKVRVELIKEKSKFNDLTMSTSKQEVLKK